MVGGGHVCGNWGELMTERRRGNRERGRELEKFVKEGKKEMEGDQDGGDVEVGRLERKVRGGVIEARV